MGARWSWTAKCSNGHIYSNFSGGADDCYECDAPPVRVIDGDDDLSRDEIRALLDGPDFCPTCRRPYASLAPSGLEEGEKQ